MTTELKQLAARFGLGESYYDYRGKFTEFTDAARLAILQAMGATHAATPEAQPAQAAWTCTTAQRQITLDVSGNHAQAGLLITLESGEQLRVTAPVTDNGHRAVTVTLPELPAGYHQLQITLGEHALHGRLIVAPTRSHEPAVMQHGTRLWGLSIQLYTLRSQHNFGMGDFADLQALIRQAAPLGCATIGLNPLHALRPADPAQCSPYSPSHRQFLNVLYIAPALAAEYLHPEVQAEVTRQQTALVALRNTAVVDYTAVARCKLPLLRLMHAALKHHASRAQSLAAFIKQQGEALLCHATYDALDAHFSAQPQRHWGWRSWPAEFHDANGAAVRTFAAAHADDIGFYCYLQWLAAEQLQQAQQLARALGMTLGLYGDVAVGVDANGSEVWSNRSLFVEQVSIGAPPDPLALKGQEWGIPPQHPLQLRAQAYEPFVQMLRANMQHCGALRIDHVMTLCRLWWVPRGFVATEGVYVHYPLDDLINIVALESQRNQCLVIGEDLGTVPDAMRDAMQRTGLYHYKVLFFEKYADGRFLLPHDYVPHALAVVTTHDLPPFNSWWSGDDIALRATLGLYPDEAVQQQVSTERETDQRQLMAALAATGLWHWQSPEALPAASFALMRAAYLYAGLSQSRLLVIQPEDLQGMTEPVNVPGTSTEHANWQRKLREDLSVTLQNAQVVEMLSAMNKARRGEFPNQS